MVRVQSPLYSIQVLVIHFLVHGGISVRENRYTIFIDY
uniref:Uncharacterized protein n=1 Tax=virus sp. ctBM815 TaxID=2825806 RepID=A0A8S5RKI3_9VIRU|nr:MAG TPA: hypothetical protein [virus sp. ctBM815]